MRRSCSSGSSSGRAVQRAASGEDFDGGFVECDPASGWRFETSKNRQAASINGKLCYEIVVTSTGLAYYDETKRILRIVGANGRTVVVCDDEVTDPA